MASCYGFRISKKIDKNSDVENYYHLTLLAKDLTGYQNRNI